MNIFKGKDFNDFKDASKIGAVMNFIKTGGLYPGKEIERWIDSLLKVKFPDKLSAIEMKDLPYHSVIYATRMNEGAIIFDSKKIREESRVSFATRCSMSIPFFFSPKTIDDINVIDGGARNNFPLEIYTKSYPTKPIIALYLKASEGSEKSTLNKKIRNNLWAFLKIVIPGLRKATTISGDLIDTITDGEEKQIVDDNLDKVVIIDPSPIKTTDFNLTEIKKELLILSGRLGALKFIIRNFKDITIDQIKVLQITERIQQIKKEL